ncbi:MAG: hypothetical protein JRJ41_05565 [Deltaproteobacteria bacterium]|nr:hypothetical protein [Deltaproteobacteria bacterium]
MLKELKPFLCEIAKSGIRKTVNSMGGKYNHGKTKLGKTNFVKFSTKKFDGNFYFPNISHGSYAYYGVYFNLPNYKLWPFSKDELVNWLSNIGLDVFMEKKEIVGGTGYRGGNFYDDFSYTAYLKVYGKKQTKNSLGKSIAVIWENSSEAKKIWCIH